MYTTTQLITGAFYASGIVSREFETVSGSQSADALNWLNDIIDEKTVNQGMIPYETTYNFNLIEGQEIYFIENLISIDTIVFYLQDVRYSMKYEQRNSYFGSPRVESIKTLPYQWYFERQLKGGNLYIYFKPDQNYPIEIHGAFRLQNVNIGQNLTEIFDNFYITYLRYALAHRICSEYNYETPINVREQLEKYEGLINNNSRLLDLRMEKVSTLQKRGQYNWAFVNLGKGWVSPG